MTTFETIEAANIQSAEELEIKESLLRQAEELADHWNNFVNGREHRFLAYFMRDHSVHEPMLEHFLSEIGADAESTGEERHPVIKSARAVLWAYSNTDENGQPFDVMFVGERVEPVQ